MMSLESQIIATLRIRRPDGFYVVAFCPICDKAEESRGQESINQRAPNAAVERIRRHMHLKHRAGVLER